jgi:hypothetical protein
MGKRCFHGSLMPSICIPPLVEVLSESCFELARVVSLSFEDGSQLRRMDENCFRFCDLQSICIPRTVEVLADSCFKDSSFASILFEAGSLLTRIEADCFACCSRLTSLTIPRSVTHLDATALMGCPGGSVSIEPGSSYFDVIDGFLIEKRDFVIHGQYLSFGPLNLSIAFIMPLIWLIARSFKCFSTWFGHHCILFLSAGVMKFLVFSGPLYPRRWGWHVVPGWIGSCQRVLPSVLVFCLIWAFMIFLAECGARLRDPAWTVAIEVLFGHFKDVVRGLRFLGKLKLGLVVISALISTCVFLSMLIWNV